MRRALLVLAGVAGLATAVVPALADDQAVTAVDYAFTPSAVAVRPGETVTITRSSSATAYHNVHWADRAAAEFAPRNTAFSVTRTFTAADDGKSFTFYCDVHGYLGMTATVYVDDAGTVPATTTPTQTQTTPSPAPGATSTTPAGPVTQTTTVAPSGAAPSHAPRLRAAVVRASRGGGLVVRLRLDRAARLTAVVRHGHARPRTLTFPARRGTSRRVLLRHPHRGRYTLTLRARVGGARSAPVTLRATVRH